VFYRQVQQVEADSLTPEVGKHSHPTNLPVGQQSRATDMLTGLRNRQKVTGLFVFAIAFN
jgi:hypothetical protein